MPQLRGSVRQHRKRVFGVFSLRQKYKNPFYKHEDALEQESQHEQATQETQPAQNEPEEHNDSVGAVFVNQQQTAREEEVHKEHAQKAQSDAFKFDFEQADAKVEKSEPSKKENKEAVSQNRGSDAFMRVITNTIKEFFEFKQFKRIPVGLAVVAGILLSPFLLAVIFMIPAFYILQFCYKIVAAPADFLLKSIREESDNTVVKAVVYFVGYPFVFLMKIALSVFSVEFFVMYFFFMLFAWIYGCGGIKFQPFILKRQPIAVRISKAKRPKRQLQSSSLFALSSAYSFSVWRLALASQTQISAVEAVAIAILSIRVSIYNHTVLVT